jgi:hypothetical protein
MGGEHGQDVKLCDGLVRYGTFFLLNYLNFVRDRTYNLGTVIRADRAVRLAGRKRPQKLHRVDLNRVMG